MHKEQYRNKPRKGKKNKQLIWNYSQQKDNAHHSRVSRYYLYLLFLIYILRENIISHFSYVRNPKNFTRNICIIQCEKPQLTQFDKKECSFKQTKECKDTSRHQVVNTNQQFNTTDEQEVTLTVEIQVNSFVGGWSFFMYANLTDSNSPFRRFTSAMTSFSCRRN